MPEDRLAEMGNNPQALVNPEALDELRAGFAFAGGRGEKIAAQIIESLREALASAISEVFLLVAGALAVAFVVTIFLKEVPLRRGSGRAGAYRRLGWRLSIVEPVEHATR